MGLNAGLYSMKLNLCTKSTCNISFQILFNSLFQSLLNFHMLLFLELRKQHNEMLINNSIKATLIKAVVIYLQQVKKFGAGHHR